MTNDEKEIQIIRIENEEFDVTDTSELAVMESFPAVQDFLLIDKSFRQVMFLHEAAIEQVTAQLNILKGEFSLSNDRNPIAGITSRIKSKESIILKMKKKNLPLTFSAMMTNIHDVAGMRVTCPFMEDVYHVARMLTRLPNVEILKTKDYIRNPKENGYRSLHIIVEVEVQFANSSKKVPLEIQIRTIAMDFWASTEHQLRYKKDIYYTDEELRKLKHCADLMAQADEEIQEILSDFGREEW